MCLCAERVEQLKNFDFEALGKAWKDGQSMAPPAAPERIGDIYPAEEMKLQETGAWSIKRLYVFKAEREKLQAQLEEEKKTLNEQFPI